MDFILHVPFSRVHVGERYYWDCVGRFLPKSVSDLAIGSKDVGRANGLRGI
jgi:hypothetical protein